MEPESPSAKARFAKEEDQFRKKEEQLRVKDRGWPFVLFLGWGGGGGYKDSIWVLITRVP